MKISQSLCFSLSLLFLFSCQKKNTTGPVVLIGEIEKENPETVVLSYPQDKRVEYLTPEVKDGKFELRIDSVENFVDLAVSVGEDVFGARVNPCDTMRMKFTPLGNGHFEVTYNGKNERESRIWTDWYDVYGYWGQYNIRPDKDPEMSFDDSMDKLLKKDSLFRDRHKGALSEYHIRRSDFMLIFLKAVLLEIRAGEQGEDAHAFPNTRKCSGISIPRILLWWPVVLSIVGRLFRCMGWEKTIFLAI